MSPSHDPIAGSAPPPADVFALAEPAASIPFEFVGTGNEYFRIWLGNLALVVLTLGLASPWAKVRRERWFHQQMRLGGHGFDFHGSPWAILRGRLLAVGLLALTQLDVLGTTVMVAASIVLYAALPWMLQRSLRFRLANTSHRGLRFAFDGTAKMAYRLLGGVVLSAAALLAVVLWFAYALNAPRWLAGALVLAPLLLVPRAHARWRRFAIDHARWGSARFSADFSDRAFAAAYLRAIGAWVAVLATAALLLLVISASAAFLGSSGAAASALLAFVVVIVFYGGWLLIGPWLTAQLQNLCWNHTLVHGRWFVSSLNEPAYVLLRLRNLALLIVTLGLYRPFAVVADVRMRAAALSLAGADDLDTIVADLQPRQTPATGAEVADLLGFDLSL